MQKHKKKNRTRRFHIDLLPTDTHYSGVSRFIFYFFFSVQLVLVKKYMFLRYRVGYSGPKHSRSGSVRLRLGIKILTKIPQNIGESRQGDAM